MTRGCGALSMLLAAMVMVGWVLSNRYLVQVLPGLAPMQFNTALGFLLMGGGITAATTRHRRLALGLVSGAGALAILTGAQYILSIDLGIDTLLISPTILDRSPSPGRMSPNTSTCFILSAAAVVVTVTAHGRLLQLFVARVVVVLVGAFGVATTIAYGLGLPHVAGFASVTWMAAHTAMGFVLLSAATMTLNMVQTPPRPACHFTTTPTVAAYVMLLMAIFGRQLLETREMHTVSSYTARQAAQAEGVLSTLLDSHLRALQDAATVWATREPSSQQAWEQTARHHLAGLIGVVAIQWKVSYTDAPWAVADGSAPTAMTASPVAVPRTDPSRPLLGAVDVQQQMGHIRLSIPVASGDGDRAALVAWISPRALFDILLIRPAREDGAGPGGFSVGIAGSLDGEEARAYARSVIVRIADREVPLTVWPDQALVETHLTLIPDLWGLTGLLVASVMAVAGWLRSVTLRQGEDMAAINDELTERHTALQHAQGRLQQAYDLLEERARELDEERAVAMRRMYEAEEARKRTAEAERELAHANRELESANEEMEQFVYAASHDLKSPLVTFVGYLKCLRQDLDNGRGDRVDRFANALERSADRMHRTIDDLLELSRVGNAALDAEPVAVEELIQWTLENLSSEVESRQPIIKIRPGLPTLMVDRPRMRQLLQNLIGNALKYACTEPGRTIEIGAVERGDEVRLYVMDDGPGIPAQFHHKIFGLFERLATDNEGTGVGLALAKRFVERYDGRIWVESESGQGATFWVVFPLRQRATQAAA